MLLGVKNVTLDLNIPNILEKNSSFLIGKGQGSVKKTVTRDQNNITVRAMPLDQLLKRVTLTHVDWVKIDAEGAELDILHGFKETIELYLPKLIVESTTNNMVLLNFMRELGYTSKLIAESYYLFTPNGSN